jgi:hypothetical protein
VYHPPRRWPRGDGGGITVGSGVPTLLISWDPDDWRLARALKDAPFLSRPDDVDQLLGRVRELVAAPAVSR